MPARGNAASEDGPVARADFVLGDRDGTTCEPAFTAFVAGELRSLGYEVKINEPYKGVELVRRYADPAAGRHSLRSEEHTSELQSLMRISYAVFCLKKKKRTTRNSKSTDTMYIQKK